MNKLTSFAVGALILWAFVRFGWLDQLLGGMIGDLTGEAARLTVPLGGLLIALALPVGLVGLGLLWHRNTRPLGVELLVIGAVVVVGAHMLPAAGNWLSLQGAAMSASLAHASTVAAGR